MTKNQFYALIGSGIIIGTLYILVQSYLYNPTQSLCLAKALTTIPCPSCGSTRAVTELLAGNFIAALKWNPLGVITFLLMVVVTPWAIFDLSTKKERLFWTYKQVETIIRRRKIAIPLIALVIINWIWNIYKGL